VVLKDQGDRLIMEIMDDGIGLPATQANQETPVNKLQERARVLEGQLQIESQTGVGTALRLAVKRAHLLARPALPV
jgi:signal transduction histidine kinase